MPNRQLLTKSLLSVFGLPVDLKTTQLIEDAIWQDTMGTPHTYTLDLLTLYASNLRNGGSPAGPRSDLFGKMTRNSLDEADFIKDNRLECFDRRLFARLAADYVEKHPLSKNGGTKNLHILKAIAEGHDDQLHSTLLYKLISSIEQFALHLINHYNGSALNFSRLFLRTVDGNDPLSKTRSASQFRARLLNELDFVLIGPAIGSNFMKDSQISLARSLPNLVDTYLGALAKPDMHVMRLMLVITGRVKPSNLEELSNLCFENRFTKLYDQTTPDDHWPTYEGQPSGEEKCLRDMNFLSYINDFSTLFLDRVLYLAGSGNSCLFQDLPKVTQLLRYRQFLSTLGFFRNP